MKIVFKAVLACQDINLLVPTKVELPSGGKALSAHLQDGNISVWFEVDLNNSLSTYNLISVGTGVQSQHFDKGAFVDTVLDNYGLVHHIYAWEEKDD